MQLAAALLDVVEVLDAVDIDEGARLRQSHAHERDEAVATRQHLGILAVLVEKLYSLLDGGGTRVFECGWGHLRASFPLLDAPLASWICFQSRSGLAGISTCLMPRGASASHMALMTAMELAIVPASPMPLTPSSLVGGGGIVRPSSNIGNSLALGSR